MLQMNLAGVVDLAMGETPCNEVIAAGVLEKRLCQQLYINPQKQKRTVSSPFLLLQ
ncbi:MAG: hypothetical protein PHU06_14210 [Gallionella sp.]|nr:hypothetical protein [Gallionella sp.]MDD4960408.1 hypothetical protein [Gallionella sp.]